MPHLKRQSKDSILIGVIPNDDRGNPNPEGLLQTYTELRRLVLDRMAFIIENYLHEDDYGKNVTLVLEPKSVSRSAPNRDYVIGRLTFKVTKNTPGIHFMKPLFSGFSKEIITFKLEETVNTQLAESIDTRRLAEG